MKRVAPPFIKNPGIARAPLMTVVDDGYLEDGSLMVYDYSFNIPEICRIRPIDSSDPFYVLYWNETDNLFYAGCRVGFTYKQAVRHWKRNIKTYGKHMYKLKLVKRAQSFLKSINHSQLYFYQTKIDRLKEEKPASILGKLKNKVKRMYYKRKFNILERVHN